METIKVRKKELVHHHTDYMDEVITTDSFDHLRHYFGYPVHEEEDGTLCLYNNSNCYTPIKLKECSRKDADLNFVNYKSKIHRYYKYI